MIIFKEPIKCKNREMSVVNHVFTTVISPKRAYACLQPIYYHIEAVDYKIIWEIA